MIICYSLNTTESAVQCSVVNSPGEFLVEFRGSMVTEQEMARQLHSDLNC
jgi:hypothetical protein